MKNRPERIVKIAQIVGDAGLATTQSMAIQSMDEMALTNSGRGNIRLSGYTTALQQLNDGGLTTYIELIWPLPGETIKSFAAGVDALCAMGSPSFVVYPLLALPNTEIAEQADKFGLDLTESRDSVGDYVYVTGTREVSTLEYKEGLWLVLALNLLYNTHALFGIFEFLKERNIRHIDVLLAFAQWAKSSSECRLFDQHRKAVETVDHAAWAYWGSVAFEALHKQREQFLLALESFCRMQSWYDDEAQVHLELDRLMLPYLFSNTCLTAWEGKHISAQAQGRRITAKLSLEAQHALSARQRCRVSAKIELNPWRGQLPVYGNANSMAMAYDYAYGQIQRINLLIPQLTAESYANLASQPV
jgi:hypothetical protein